MKIFLRFGNVITLALIMLLAIIACNEMGLFNRFKGQSIEIITSDIDYDNDGIDDYTDILNGAKDFIEEKPKYKSKYYDGGYPNDGYYVCTDVFWYALKEAGYDFKAMIDEDIKENQSDYDIEQIDSNIDFRRVRNIKVFLDKYITTLTTDPTDVEEFQPGDIVIFDNSHIAIISDKVNSKQIRYIIHHDGFHDYEDDGLLRNKIIGHYRWRVIYEK